MMLKIANSIAIFARYNVVALTATAIDFLLLIFLTEVVGLWYLFSAITGSVAGGVVAFILERNWTFQKREGAIKTQIFRFTWIWITSLLLNIGLLYLMVDIMQVQYIVSRIAVAVVVGIGLNFVAHKYYIFR